MSAKRPPSTPAVGVLRSAGVDYTEYVYDYSRFPGALGAAKYIGIDPHLTAKTIVFATKEGTGVVVLMHGDLEVSTKKLARELGTKSTRPATQAEGRRWTGYEFGGTSPLGMRSELPVFADQRIADLDRVYVNAGRRGFVVGVAPADLLGIVDATLTDLAA